MYRRSIAGALAVFTMTATACAGAAVPTPSTSSAPQTTPLGPFPSALASGLEVETDVAYTAETDCGGTPCTVPGDVLAPASGQDLPTVVMLGGGSTPFAERRYQAGLAAELAGRGAVVFLMSYRSAVTGNYDSDSASDARCAVVYARANTAAYGGDPDRVVIVGHSQGGLIGLEVALAADEELEACAAEGNSRPDGVIGLGAPGPRLAVAVPNAPPVWLFAGADDGDAEAAAKRLRDRGVRAEAQELPGVTHEGITDPAAAPEVVDFIMEALGSI